MSKPEDAPQEPVNSIREALSEAIEAQNEPVVEVEKEESKQARAPDGKFAKEETPTETPVDEQPKVEEPAVTVLEPEDHWSDQDKTAFRSIPPEHRKWVMDRYKRLETDNTKKSQEAATLRSFKQSLDAVLEPHLAELRLQGVDELGAVRMLFGIRDYLRKDPQGGIQWLAKQYGVDLTNLTVDPANAVNPQLQQLDTRLNQFEQTLEQQRVNEAFRTLDSFSQEKDASGNLTHPHFEAVVNDMTQLMKSGMVQMGDLKNAYDKALRLHPELTPATPTPTPAPAQVSPAPSVAQVKDETLEKAAAAAKAKKAAVGVSSGGSGKTDKKMTLREELSARINGSLN